MLRVMLVAQFLLLFLCVCNGTPPGRPARERAKYAYYTIAEENFIINHIKKLSGSSQPIYDMALWKEIARMINRMPRSPDFPTRRSPSGLSRHFEHKMLNGRAKAEMPESWVKNHQYRQKSRGKNQQNFLPEDDVANNKILTRRRWKRFTPEEDQFLLDFILYSKMKTPIQIYKLEMWEYAAAKLDEKHTEDPDHYNQGRTGEHLRSHFSYIMGKLSDKQRAVVYNVAEGKMSPGQITCDMTIDYKKRFSDKENKFILDQLMLTDCTKLFKASLWITIKQEHDKLVEAKIPGFKNRRTFENLRQHFQDGVYSKRNVPRSLMEKFSYYFPEILGSTEYASGSRGQHLDEEESDEDDPDFECDEDDDDDEDDYYYDEDHCDDNDYGDDGEEGYEEKEE